jgi:NADH-quinone oxidoreductase subunit E
MSFSLTDATRALFDREVAKYPADQKQSAVMACLSIVQHEQGYVSQEAEAAVAAHLGMPPIAVHEVTTFYNMYNQQPVGLFKLNVCTNLPSECLGACADAPVMLVNDREMLSFMDEKRLDDLVDTLKAHAR